MKPIILFIAVVTLVVGCPSKNEVPQVNPTPSKTPPPEDSAVITEYVAKHKSWTPAEYRIEELRRENGYIVYEVLYLEDLKRSYVGGKEIFEMGGGKSFAVDYDPVEHKVIREVGFQ